jgi:hypothetical protein
LLFAVAWGANHFVPLLLLYRARLGLGPAELATVFGVYALGLVPGLLVGGPASDRFGRRAVVLPSALVALVGTAVLGAAGRTFAALLIGRAIVGLGSGAAFTAGTAWVQDLALASASTSGGVGARRATIALSAGFGGGPLVASVLAQTLPAPLVVPYVVQGCVLLVACAWAVAVPPAPAAGGAAGERHERTFPAGFATAVAPMAPWVFGFPAVSFAVLPPLVRDRVPGFEVLFAGVVTAATLLSGVAAQPTLRRRSPAAAARTGLAVGTVGLLVAAAAVARRSPMGVLGAAVLLGVGYGGCLVGGLRFVEANTSAARRGRVTGVFYVLAYLGFAAPLVLAALAARVGPVTALLATAALAAATWVVTIASATGQGRGRGQDDV